jgi:hypothetical protein
MDNQKLIEDLRKLSKGNACDSNSLYDYVANHYYEMTKEQLKELFINMNYSTYECMTSKDFSNIENRAITYTIQRME